MRFLDFRAIRENIYINILNTGVQTVTGHLLRKAEAFLRINLFRCVCALLALLKFVLYPIASLRNRFNLQSSRLQVQLKQSTCEAVMILRSRFLDARFENLLLAEIFLSDLLVLFRSTFTL
uniref:PBC domain-containing protein n=1 Tax=Ascaris lumbricoides TaxID=6252 RepID=A0A0M3HJX3_ASCLU